MGMISLLRTLVWGEDDCDFCFGGFDLGHELVLGAKLAHTKASMSRAEGTGW